MLGPNAKAALLRSLTFSTAGLLKMTLARAQHADSCLKGQQPADSLESSL